MLNYNYNKKFRRI